MVAGAGVVNPAMTTSLLAGVGSTNAFLNSSNESSNWAMFEEDEDHSESALHNVWLLVATYLFIVKALRPKCPPLSWPRKLRGCKH